jgi:hypothetical protein
LVFDGGLLAKGDISFASEPSGTDDSKSAEDNFTSALTLRFDRAIVLAGVDDLVPVAIFLRRHLASEPLPSIDAKRRALDRFAVLHIASVTLPVPLHPVVSAVVSDRQNIVDKAA